MGGDNRMRRKGRKPSKEAIINRLQKIFHRDRYDKRKFDIVESAISDIVKVKHTDRNANQTVLKVQALSNKYSLHKKHPDRQEEETIFSSNLDDFEDDFRELRDKWINYG